MENTEYLHLVTRTLLLVMYASLPVLAIAAVVGFLVGLIQAVTQIQDQSLPQTLKLVAVLVTVALLGPLLSGPLLHHAEAILDQFPSLSR
jgi:type III secretion protein S